MSKSAKDRLDAESVVVTFDPHPRMAMGRAEGMQLLTTIEERAYLLGRYGIDRLVVAHFDERFRTQSYEEFIRSLVEGVGMVGMVVGYNHHFGHNKDGDFRFLQSLQGECGFDVCEISRQQIDDEKVSSTVVRSLIAEGDMAHAMRLLGRPYILIANIKEYVADPYKLLPPNGRYRVQIEGQGSAVLMISHNGINLDFASTYNLEKPLQIGFIDRIG